MCTHRSHVAETVRRLVQTRRILLHIYVAARTVCNSSAHDATLLSVFRNVLLQTILYLASFVRKLQVSSVVVQLIVSSFLNKVRLFVCLID